jgi:SAM-dependent methyltransferase
VGIHLQILATDENFDEAEYLAANPDVVIALRAGKIPNGYEHFKTFGRAEGRYLWHVNAIREMRQKKLANLERFLRLDMPHIRRGDKYDFLTQALRNETGIVETEAVSANGYDGYAMGLIQEFSNGLVLDCGSGKRPIYFPNVVNFEIVDYDTTDIIGVGESLPFKSGCFDAVISSAVLEHVRNPFVCATEIVRVLRPGGKLFCCVPFLQPLHGYPHHYYNMTPQGLKALFERDLHIDDHLVIESILPIWSLTWIVQSWADGLDPATKEEFLNLSVRDLLSPAGSLLDRTWVKGLASEKNFELASATLLLAHKPV